MLPARVTAGAAFHGSRSLGAVWHLEVHLPRRKRTHPCTLCVPGVTTGAECHATRGSGENLNLQVPIDRARGPEYSRRVTFRPLDRAR
jgi:hypothetical protein